VVLCFLASLLDFSSFRSDFLFYIIAKLKKSYVLLPILLEMLLCGVEEETTHHVVVVPKAVALRFEIRYF
jgi:hypothetical protein